MSSPKKNTGSVEQKEETTVKDEETAETEEDFVTPQEIVNIVSALKALKVKPKADTPEDFLHWMSSMAKASASTEKKETQAHALPKTNPLPLPSDIYGKHANPHYYPRISTFSGDAKSESTYELWKYEVECLMNESYHPESIHHAIRRSLKGEASHIIMHLGPGASISTIIRKLDSIYGTVDEKEDILSEFYSARQKEDEGCAQWSCRLEDILSKAVRKGLVSSGQSDDMLRTMFFKGLRPTLKDISGHLKDRKLTFDELRSAVRKVELEHQPTPHRDSSKKQATAKVAQPDQSSSRFESLEAMINQLTTEVKGLKDQHYSYSKQRSQHYDQPKQPNKKGRRGGSQGNRGSQYQQESTGYSDFEEEPRGSKSRGPIVCYRCGQEGHIARGCRVRTDFLRQPLNFKESTSGDEGLAQRRRVPEKRV